LLSAARPTKAMSRARQKALDQIYAATHRVASLEDRLDIETRWLPGSVEYEIAAGYLHNSKFHKVLDKLQGLLLSRMFEMAKANVAGTGKLRVSAHTNLYLLTSSLRLQASYIDLEAPQDAERCYQVGAHIV
jgi:hypothetical protein